MDNVEKLKKLIASPHESECVEFKVDNASPDRIGEYISALSNSAALVGSSFGYVVWGVEDVSHNVVGTTFDPMSKKGNEPLHSWLASMTEPSIHFRFSTIEVESKRVVLLEVPAATHTPVKFQGQGYVRIGNTTRKLKDHPERERALWAGFTGATFETEAVKIFSSTAEAVGQLDLEAYLKSTKKQQMRVESLYEELEHERLLKPLEDGRCAITALGGLLFAKSLDDFSSLRRKAPRAIFYKGKNREIASHEQEGKKGYAAGFEGLIRYLDDRLPRSELIAEALRREVPVFPAIAVRELVANALIHQDLTQTGAGPMIEVFEDRIEISNPGTPLIDPLRLIDAPPRSRNEKLANFLRRIGFCEERGSGLDRVVSACETFQLPAPKFMVVEGFTRSILYAPRPLKDMSPSDRMRACYQHSVLQWLSDSQMTNASLRKRFGIKDGNAAQASRIIKETLDEKLIREFDPENTSNRHNKYVPFWAA